MIGDLYTELQKRAEQKGKSLQPGDNGPLFGDVYACLRTTGEWVVDTCTLVRDLYFPPKDGWRTIRDHR